uniref:Uncharacterized protein n=1 Tax=Ciona intestinalis TaxID=7719 RepID=F6WXW3_CIOIN
MGTGTWTSWWPLINADRTRARRILCSTVGEKMSFSCFHSVNDSAGFY